MWWRLPLVRVLLWSLYKLGWQWPVVFVPVQTLVPGEDMLRDSSTFVKTIQ